MPANTPKGYPYPLGTDRVMDGDNAIHDLATAIDTKLGVAAAGVVSVTIGTINTSVSAAITFPVGLFTAPPVLTAGPNGNNPMTIVACAGPNPTTTGGTVFGARTASTGSVNVAWLAVQLP